MASERLLSLAGCPSRVCRETREDRGWSPGHDHGGHEAGVRAQCGQREQKAGATLPSAEEVGSEMRAQKLVTGWSRASAGQPARDVQGQRPAGGGGRQEPDHGCR